MINRRGVCAARHGFENLSQARHYNRRNCCRCNKSVSSTIATRSQLNFTSMLAKNNLRSLKINGIYQTRQNTLNASSAHSFSGVATGGGEASGATCPPTSDRTSREIDADPRRFSCPKKMGVGFQDLLRRFTCADATADVLWSYD